MKFLWSSTTAWSCLSVVIFTIFGCLGYTAYSQVTIEPQDRLTVWVHGTSTLCSTLKVTDRFLRPSREGLSLAKDLDPKYHTRTIAHALAEADAQQFPLDSFYAYRWNGYLSFAERKKEARRLYKLILELIDQHKTTHGTTPIITIITHSHGGNVGLNLACVQDEFEALFQVDKLILLACPVQQATECYTQDKIFKEIYSLYSKLDSLQVADPQGLTSPTKTKGLFSGRRFPTQPNLKQAKVQFSFRPLIHVEFMMSKFLKNLPTLINKMTALPADNNEHLLRI